MTEKPNDFMEGFGYGITLMASKFFMVLLILLENLLKGLNKKKI